MSQPRVGIGLPVHNGENFLAEALDALLAQTYEDFELIISDNASTDGTAEICQSYAAADRRIRYFRSEENLGASRNFNRAFELSSGEYFKWAAHDDLCEPTFVERCVEVLDQDPSVILSFCRTREIDEHGTVVKDYVSKVDLASPKPHERLFAMICRHHLLIQVFGLMRADVLRQTHLIGYYVSSDRVLLAELALRGRLYEVPEFLFYRRDHPDQSYRKHRGRHQYQSWFDPRRTDKTAFPHWRLLFEFFVTIGRVPLSLGDRVRCYLTLGWWIRRHWRYLAANLLLTEPDLRDAWGDPPPPDAGSSGTEAGSPAAT